MPAALWRRAAARLADLATVFFLQLVLVLLVAGPLVDALSDLLDGGPWGDEAGARALYLLLLGSYEIVFLVAHGQTPGMDRFDVKVSPPRSNADPGAARTLRRTLPLLAVASVPDLRLVAVLGAVALATALARRDRRAVHDLLGGTWLVAYDAEEEDPCPTADLGPLDELRRRRRLIGPDR